MTIFVFFVLLLVLGSLFGIYLKIGGDLEPVGENMSDSLDHEAPALFVPEQDVIAQIVLDVSRRANLIQDNLVGDDIGFRSKTEFVGEELVFFIDRTPDSSQRIIRASYLLQNELASVAGGNLFAGEITREEIKTLKKLLYGFWGGFGVSTISIVGDTRARLFTEIRAPWNAGLADSIVRRELPSKYGENKIIQKLTHQLFKAFGGSLPRATPEASRNALQCAVVDAHRALKAIGEPLVALCDEKQKLEILIGTEPKLKRVDSEDLLGKLGTRIAEYEQRLTKVTDNLQSTIHDIEANESAAVFEYQTKRAQRLLDSLD